jgi:uncharacterized GH25 family protein
MKIRLLALAAGTAMTLVAPAHAHNQWLKPSITVLSDTTQSVTVDAAASTIPFQANHAPLNVDNVQVVKPDGSTGAIENVARGRYRSTFDVKIDMPGTWRVGTVNTGVGGTFKVDGEEWRVGRRRGPPPQAGTAGAAEQPRLVPTIEEIPEGATDLALVETHSRNEFFVTAGNPTEAVYQPTGKGLEFQPLIAPTDLVSDEPAQFRFLIDGQPAAGLKVDLVADGQRYHPETHSLELTTDAEGLITVEWPVAGFYWLSASAEDDKAANPRASKRRMNYIATLEVVAP